MVRREPTEAGGIGDALQRGKTMVALAMTEGNESARRCVLHRCVDRLFDVVIERMGRCCECGIGAHRRDEVGPKRARIADDDRERIATAECCPCVGDEWRGDRRELCGRARLREIETGIAKLGAKTGDAHNTLALTASGASICG